MHPVAIVWLNGIAAWLAAWALLLAHSRLQRSRPQLPLTLLDGVVQA
jgi:hypothetical protein